MDQTTLQSVLRIGEHIAVEFKRCGNQIEHDVYETVCAFLNRHGGDVFLGVQDDGTVCGVNADNAPNLVKSFISTMNNPNAFVPTIYLAPEIMQYEGKTIIHIHVPPSAEVHKFKNVIYDRVNDSDIKVTATSQIASMYIRKQNIFTEKRIYPFVEMGDLRLDLLPKIRQMAKNHAGGNHPWEHMNDQELLQSAGLYGTDIATGEKGYNLAAVMLLGSDDIILNACPAYETDALVRKVNIDRYDDREIVKTNLIESYDQLMDFARKHLPDKFFLEDDVNVSLRNILAREMIGNTLMHREFTSTYAAKFVIEKDRMYVENASRASKQGAITPENLEPNPKNPIIASFFRTIGRADRLGSGVRNLYKYSKYYSGEAPSFTEGDVFRIVVPLNDAYSFDFDLKVPDTEGPMPDLNLKVPDIEGVMPDSHEKVPDLNEKQIKRLNELLKNDLYSLQEKQIIEFISVNGEVTSNKVAELLQVKPRRARAIINHLLELKVIERFGLARNTTYRFPKEF